MKIALCQFKVIPFRTEDTLTRVKSHIIQAKKNGADLIAFPELIFGYMLEDVWTEDDFVELLESKNKIIADMAKTYNIVVIFGNIHIDKTKKGTDGRFARFNSAIIADIDGSLQYRYKTCLPTYRVFSDFRYFSDPRYFGIYPTPVILKNGVKIGIEICEDLYWK
jgi:predicted amidohydrolase